MADEYALVKYICNVVGAPAPAIRLVVGLIVCQILSILYRYIISTIPSSDIRKHLTLAAGVFVGYFVYGNSVIFHGVSALVFYLLFSVFGSKVALRLNFVYQIACLLVGYYVNNMIAGYAINWTTSQSILTLKLIGLGFDIVDEKKPGEPVPLPSVLDVLGYTFFFGTYLVGPLDDFRRFQNFMSKNLFPEKSSPPLSMGLVRVSSGAIYLMMSLFFKSVFTTDYLFTESYLNLGFLQRLFYVTAWGHVSLYKYLGVWCVAESTCMYMGYTYVNQDRWNGLRNVSTSAFHKAMSLQDLIDSWNINTNKWCLKYVYKRCRFLGNKNLSQLVTLVFLAVWHGLHFGYLTCFCQEFLFMLMENNLAKNTIVNRIGGYAPRQIVAVFLWIYAKIFLSFALVGFELYNYDSILRVYKSLYFVCPILAIVVIFTCTVFKGNKVKDN